MIESKFFYLKFFKKLLTQILNSSISGNFTIDKTLEEFLEQLPGTSSTPSHQNKILFDQTEFPHMSLQMFMFSMIKSVQILQVMARLICGVPTVVTSFTNSQISIATFAIFSLIYPLEWPYLFIPLVNSTTYSNFKSPIYIVGVLFNIE